MNPTSLLRNAASSRSFSRKGSRPSSVTVPDVGGSSAPRMYSSVLLPLPDGPMMETASPRRREREMPERIGIGPRGVAYSLVRFVASSKADPTPILTAAASWSGDAAQLQNQRQAGR